MVDIFVRAHQNEGKSESLAQPLVGQTLDILRAKSIVFKNLT